MKSYKLKVCRLCLSCFYCRCSDCMLKYVEPFLLTTFESLICFNVLNLHIYRAQCSSSNVNAYKSNLLITPGRQALINAVLMFIDQTSSSVYEMRRVVIVGEVKA